MPPFCDPLVRNLPPTLPASTFAVMYGGHKFTFASNHHRDGSSTLSDPTSHFSYRRVSSSYGTYGFGVPLQNLRALREGLEQDLAAVSAVPPDSYSSPPSSSEAVPATVAALSPDESAHHHPPSRLAPDLSIYDIAKSVRRQLSQDRHYPSFIKQQWQKQLLSVYASAPLVVWHAAGFSVSTEKSSLLEVSIERTHSYEVSISTIQFT